jgi:small GTP-binding protein
MNPRTTEPAAASPATWRLSTPSGVPGAVACFELSGDIDAALSRLKIKPVACGAISLRDLCAIDTGIIARYAPDSCFIMPHGGPAITRELCEALTRAGLAHADADTYPEARTDIERRMLAALARAKSPIAVDLLLDQPARWSRSNVTSDPAHDTIRNRLIDPPLVVAVGPANIGKSTLANELAGRAVSIVADEPGTTRDHVGVMLDMAGLVVRYVDTPGLRAAPDPAERDAIALTLNLAAGASLLVLLGDAHAPPPQREQVTSAAIPTLRVHLRADLGPPASTCDAHISVLKNQGLPDLVRLIRDTLVPPEVLKDPRPWTFWG